MLSHVYQDSPQLNAERANLRILDEHVSQAVAGFRPQLALTGAIGEARVSEQDAAWNYGQDRDAALVATQPLYNAATLGQWHATEQRVLEGRARLLASEQKIFLTAITAWLDMCEKEALLVLDRDNVNLAASYLRQTRQRLAAGDGTQTDLDVAESRAAGNEARYAMAEAARDSVRATYQRVTGLPPQTTDFPPLPANIPRTQEEAEALAQQNPELAQADYEVAATQDDIDSANGARWPSIFLRGSVSDESAEDLGLAHLREDSLTINASFPLYAGGSEFSREREAKIAHEKSRFDSIATARNITEEARQAWSRFKAAQSVIRASDDAAHAADNALKGISEEQKHGTRTLTEVLDAQTQSLNAKITALQAQKDLRLQAYQLMAAAGQLTAKGLELPTTIYDPTAHYEDVASRWFGASITPDDKTPALSQELDSANPPLRD
jgi:outer membrane protein